MLNFYTQKIVFLILSMISMYVVLTLVNQQADMDTNWFSSNEIVLHDKTISLNQHEYTMSKSIVPLSKKGEGNDMVIGHASVQLEIDSIIHLCTTFGHTQQRPTILEPPNGVLLFGPPGTGKTTLAKVIATKLDSKCSFLHVSPDNIENKYYGEGLKQLTAIFTLAKKIKPCVIFFDEIDGYMSIRSANDQSHTNTMKTSMLTLLDSIQKEWNILFIATTNRKESLDPALLRRLDIQLKMGLPCHLDKMKFISRYIDTTNKLTKDELEGFVREFTLDMSLCDIRNFCKFAVRQFILNNKEVRPKKSMKVDVPYEEFMRYHNQYVDLRYNDA